LRPIIIGTIHMHAIHIWHSGIAQDFTKTSQH